MDLVRCEHGPFRGERARSTLVEEQVARPLFARILSFAGLSLDEVVNCAEAKRRVRLLYRVACAAAWEEHRTRLHRRASEERWVRENR